MADESYSDGMNRETWDVYRWLSKHQGQRYWCMKARRAESVEQLAEEMKRNVESLGGGLRANLKRYNGDWNKVNWHEIAAVFKE